MMKCTFVVVSFKSGSTYWIFIEWVSLNSVVFHRYDQFDVTKTSYRTEKQAAIKGVLESLKGNTTLLQKLSMSKFLWQKHTKTTTLHKTVISQITWCMTKYRNMCNLE